jgi:hypothetical protein
MAPIAVTCMDAGEWSIIHQCESCGFIRKNRIQADDNEELLLHLALKPLSQLPFPVKV